MFSFDKLYNGWSQFNPFEAPEPFDTLKRKTPNVTEETAPKKYHVSPKKNIVELLNEYPFFSNQRSSAIYQPLTYFVASDNVERAKDIIGNLLLLPHKRFVQNKQLHISQDEINAHLEKFKKDFKEILVNEKNLKTDLFLSELFIRILSVRILMAIRAENILITDILLQKKDKAALLKSAEEFSKYIPRPQKDDNNFSSYPDRRRYDNKAWRTIADYYILDEMLSTPKKSRGKIHSMKEHWLDDSFLLQSTYSALRFFLSKRKTPFFQGKNITKILYWQSPVSHFRASTVIEIYEFLVSKKYFDKDRPISLLDTSLGWFGALTPALLYKQGEAFSGFTGFDPNPKVIDAAHQLIDNLLIEPYHPERHRFFNTYKKGVETLTEEEIRNVITLNGGDGFNMAMTSPPFHTIEERYGSNGENKESQVWYRYKTRSEYQHQFLIPMILNNYKMLAPRGIFVVHFKEENLFRESLELMNQSIENESTRINILMTGEYFPAIRVKKNNGDSASEKLFFIQRAEYVPLYVPKTLLQLNENPNEKKKEKKNKRPAPVKQSFPAFLKLSAHSSASNSSAELKVATPKAFLKCAARFFEKNPSLSHHEYAKPTVKAKMIATNVVADVLRAGKK